MPFLTRDACHWLTNFLSFLSYLERVLGRSMGCCLSGALDDGNVCCVNKPAVSVLEMAREVESGRKLDGRLLCVSASGSCPELSVFRRRDWFGLATDTSGLSATNKVEPLLRLRAAVPRSSRA